MITATVEAGSILLLEPANELCFALDRARHKARSVLTLSNVSLELDVAFKVRTRNPDVFAVKPTHGVIRAGESAQVILSVAPRSVVRLERMRPAELEKRRSSDLFLIQSVELTPDMPLAKAAAASLKTESPLTSDELRAFWKQVPRETVDENKLACRFVVSSGGPRPAAAANATTTSFLSASQSMQPDFIATARESFASQSTVYGDCFSEAGDAQQVESMQRGPTEIEGEATDRQSRSERVSRASMRSSGLGHGGRRETASPTSADGGGRMSSSELSRENLRRLSSDNESWISASPGSPTNSAVSAATSAYGDCRSISSTMLDGNDTLLSARSAFATTETRPRSPTTTPPAAPTPSLLFSVHPHDVLTFQLKRAPRFWSSSSFFIVNASQTECLAFKVRTTNQEGYLVKPTRGLVAVTSAQKIEVQLCAPREGFLDRSRREARDAFLIEAAAISPAQYRELQALQGRQRARELSALWSVLPSSDHGSEMLTVELAVDPEDEDDLCTPIRPDSVAMGTPMEVTGDRSRVRLRDCPPASGESTDGSSRRRSMSSSRSKAPPPKPPSVVVMSPDAMDLVDFSDPHVSFFV